MKSFDFVDTDDDFKINRNMRCIEISARMPYVCPETAINRNMRCIEITKKARGVIP